MKTVDLDKDKLYNLYIEQRLSTKEIAMELNVGKNTVNRYLKKYDIPIRSKESSQKEAMIKLGNKLREENTESNLLCAECNKPIYVKKSLLDKADKHFCSVSCSSTYYGRTREKTGEYLKCDFCGKETYKNRYLVDNFKHHFCSKECHSNWMTTEENLGVNNPQYNRIKTYCSYCGEELYIIPSQYENQKHNYCDIDCMSKHYVGLVYGENHPSWKGGYKDIYYGPNWKRVRAEARERDNYTCQRCGVTEADLGQALPVHHIIPIRKHNSWITANKLSNLTSLCPTCHGIVEHHGIDFEIKHRIVQTTTLNKWPGKARSSKKH